MAHEIVMFILIPFPDGVSVDGVSSYMMASINEDRMNSVK